MAFNSQNEAASTPASTTSSSSISFSASFSVFQEGPGQPLVFSPPLHTPELQSLVDRFLALDVPIPMKMEMLRCDFEAHVARTNERYKTYFVPAASPASAPAVTTVPSPPVFMPSPAPLLLATLVDASATGSLSSTPGDSSYSGGFLFETPAMQQPQQLRRTSAESLVLSSTADAASSVFAHSVSMLPSVADNSAFHGDAASSGFAQSSAIARAPASSNSTPSPRSARGALRPSRGPSLRRHLTDDSLQIITRTGENVTHVSSRATRSHEDRENTRLVRQRGACPDCRRKKQRCAPGHLGVTVDRSVIAPRPAAPYPVPAQSGRAKQEALAAQAARATQEKVEGKLPEVIVNQPVFGDVAWAGINSTLLPSSVSPADDLSVLDSLLDWGDLDTTSDMFLFSSGTDEDLPSASTSAAIAPATEVADVRPPMTAVAHGQLYYAPQQPATMNALCAPTRPQQYSSLRLINFSANAGSSAQLENSRREPNTSCDALQFSFSPKRLQPSSMEATHVELSAHTTVPEVGTPTIMSGVLRSGASSPSIDASKATGTSSVSASLLDTAVNTSQSIVFSSPTKAAVSSDVNPIVFSSDTRADACSSDVNPIVFSSSDSSANVSPIIFSSENSSADVNPIVFSSENSSADVNPIVLSSESNSADVSPIIFSSENSSADVNSIVFSSENSSVDVSPIVFSSENSSANANPIVFSSESSSANINTIVFSTDDSSSLTDTKSIVFSSENSDVCASDVHSDASSSDAGSDKKPEDQEDAQTAAVAAAETLFVMATMATMATVAETVLPALSAWFAANASGALVVDLSNEMERMRIGTSTVACQ